MANNTIRLRDNETGEVREIPGDWGPGDWFQWEENDYACDCNRWIFFYCRAGNYEVPPTGELSCGEGRFELVKFPWEPFNESLRT